MVTRIKEKLKGWWNLLSTWGDRRGQSGRFFLIYTLGKVGSSTLYATLKKKLPGVPVHHVHYLSEKFLGDLLPKSDDYFKKHIGLGRAYWPTSTSTRANACASSPWCANRWCAM